MQDKLKLRCREDGTWEEYKDPFVTIHCPTEEDFLYLRNAVEYYKANVVENKPLTLDELVNMQGEIVYCTPLNDWAKVTEYGLIYFGSTKTTSWAEIQREYRKFWLAYRNKPTGQ